MRELRSLLPYLRPYLRTYALGLLLVVISNFFATLGPRFLEEGIDALRQHEPFRQVQIAVGLLLAVALASGVGRYGMRQLLNSGSRRVETDLRDRLYRHLQRMSAEFYDRYPTGDVMARTTNDLLAVRMVAGPALMYLVDTSIRTLLVAPAMLSYQPPADPARVSPPPGTPGDHDHTGRGGARRSQAIQAHFSVLTSHAHENLSGVRVVRAYRQEAAETGHFRELSEEYLRKNLSLARVQGLFFPLLTTMGGLSAVVVLYVGGKQVMAGQVTVGEFVAFGVYLGHAGVAHDRPGLGGEPGAARRRLHGPDQPAVRGAAGDREPGEPHAPAARARREGRGARPACGSATPARTIVDGCSRT